MAAATPTDTNQPREQPAVVRPVKGGKRGRPATASRDDVLALVTELYLDGQRVDITVVAARLGLGRATIYRWFGSREALLGEVIARQLELLVARKRAEVRRRGAAGVLEVLDRVNRTLTRSRRGPAAARAGARQRDADADLERRRGRAARGRVRAGADRRGDGVGALPAAGRPGDARVRAHPPAPRVPLPRHGGRDSRRLRAAAGGAGRAARGRARAASARKRAQARTRPPAASGPRVPPPVDAKAATPISLPLVLSRPGRPWGPAGSSLPGSSLAGSAVPARPAGSDAS